ncbi:MAG TPA: SPOR domain-containing protein [Edaphobacter sp.]
MNTRYEDDTDLHGEPLQRDREISLGVATILGIFFVLALICAVFFGFGYSLGRRSAQPQTTPLPSEPAATLSSNRSKPSPGSATITAPPSKYASDAPASPETKDQTRIDQQDSLPTSTTKTVALDSTLASPAAKPAVTTPIATKPTPTPIPTVAPSTPGAALVQVAAVSHQEDADILLSALKRRGYAVTVRHEPQDKLLHIQIGPFATRKDAEAMRQRLLSDGYNAIVK